MKVDIDPDVSAARASLSVSLFGNQDRLTVAAAVAHSQPGDLYGQSIAEQTGLPQSRVGPQLKRLVQAGLLTELPRVGGDRRVFYERHASVFWDLAPSLQEELVAGTIRPLRSVVRPGVGPRDQRTS